MRGNPLLSFHRSAEAAGYPALLIVSVVCLGLVVVPLALLGLTDAGWVLAVALLNLIVAIAVLAGAVEAAMSDYDEPAAGRAGPGATARSAPRWRWPSPICSGPPSGAERNSRTSINVPDRYT
jgi:hypothetical protein